MSIPGSAEHHSYKCQTNGLRENLGPSNSRCMRSSCRGVGFRALSSAPTMIRGSNGSRWICKSREQVAVQQQQAKVRLFCIPPAGTGCWVYQSWWKSLPEYAEVLPIELPGSGIRIREPRNNCMQSLVHGMLQALAPLLQQEVPYAIFGHSMGAWVAFELAQEAARQGLPTPVLLIVSGNRAPHLAGPRHDVDPTIMHTSSFMDFWAAFERRYGTNPDLADIRTRQMVWPSLQADFRLVETYRADRSELLPCSLVAVGALQDKRYTADQVHAWKHHTCKPFEEYWVAGGHDYIITSALTAGLMTIIQTELSKSIVI